MQTLVSLNGGLIFHGFNGFIADLELDDVVLS